MFYLWRLGVIPHRRHRQTDYAPVTTVTTVTYRDLSHLGDVNCFRRDSYTLSGTFDRLGIQNTISLGEGREEDGDAINALWFPQST